MNNQLLSAERETELFHAWRQRGDRKALGQLVVSLRPFVLSLAKRYRGPNNTDDLVASGYMGALEAAQRFDPNRGTRFLTYAVHWIRSAILAELRAQTDHGTGSYEARVTSIEHDVPANDVEAPVCPMGTAERALAVRDAASVTMRALEGLDDRSRRILTLRFLRDEEVTLAGVANEVGLSRERVRQIEASALTLLRKRLSRSGLQGEVLEA